ncbi:heme/hemin ABC transporter substrate-binding protein [Entomohabitans teleogrylli]|uniref:heme/hemin ABC transporter substrate-binding protein n=1 Tax=Entomohabitans teleogrylli TaxID=1384589 RepID=UPI00073D312B|nr:ABC transporter substrate-binding protein [Entomohabitans teleogrylli]
MKRLLIALLCLPLLAWSTPPRVVSLGGDVTEIVWALGAGDTLVARDSTSLQPQAVKALPDVGYLRQLNAEGILAMRPTLVLASAQAQPSLALKQVQDSNVPVVTVPASLSPAAISEKIAVIAAALGKTDAGEQLITGQQKLIDALPRRALNVRVLFIMSHSGINAMAAGSDTAADAAIRAAGLTNALANIRRYQSLSREGVITSRPDLIVVGADGLRTLGGENGVLALPGVEHTPAGKHGRIMVVDEVALLGFGLRTAQTILTLRRQAEALR